MSRRLRYFNALFCLLSVLLCFSLQAEPASFDGANRLYEQGKYRDAIEAYESLLGGGTVSPAVWFNLGNAHFKAGHIGEAIAAYRQAEALAPRDPDVRANLEFAKRQVSGPTLHRSTFNQTVNKLSINEWTLLATVPLWAWFGLMIAGQLKPQLRSSLRKWAWTTGLAAVMAGVVVGVAYQERYGQTTVVVSSRDAVVRLGPFDESPSTVTAVDGAEFTLHDAKADWYQISDGQKVLGWLKTNAVVAVR